MASAVANGQFQLKNGSTVLATINVPNTGGWQNWQTVTATVTLSAGSQTLRLLSTSVAGWNIIYMNVTAGLPSPWQTADIGAVGLAGSVGVNAGTYTLKGSGTGIASTADQFRYIYQTMSGDGSITARLNSQSGTLAAAQIGVMVRETTATNSRFAMVARVGSGATNMRATRRTSTGGASATTTSTSQTPPNCWVRVTRTGNSLVMARSTDGTTWTTITTTTVTMTANITAGLVVTSGSNTVLDTDVLDNVTVVP